MIDPDMRQPKNDKFWFYLFVSTVWRSQSSYREHRIHSSSYLSNTALCDDWPSLALTLAPHPVRWLELWIYHLIDNEVLITCVRIRQSSHQDVMDICSHQNVRRPFIDARHSAVNIFLTWIDAARRLQWPQDLGNELVIIPPWIIVPRLPAKRGTIKPGGG
jgi:hypothetical protein